MADLSDLVGFALTVAIRYKKETTYQICCLNIEVSEELYINVNSSLRIQIKRLHYHCHHIQKFLYYERSKPFPASPKPLKKYGKAG